jgi:hypothetical protein
VEKRALRTNIARVVAKVLYECILIRFGCPLTIVIDQGVHFINDTIKYLIDHFLLKHVNFTTYYVQGNGQAKSINKVFGTFLTKLVSENITNWDEHLCIVLFSYICTYKIATWYTISISLWITSIDAHRVHSANCLHKSKRQYSSKTFN